MTYVRFLASRGNRGRPARLRRRERHQPRPDGGRRRAQRERAGRDARHEHPGIGEQCLGLQEGGDMV